MQSSTIPNLESVSLEDMKAMWTQISIKNPTLVPPERNGDTVIRFLKDHGLELNIKNLCLAIKILGYPFDKLDRQKAPPIPPQPPQPVIEEPVEPEEVLEAWQIRLNPPPSELQLRCASKEAVRDYLKRARARQK